MLIVALQLVRDRRYEAYRAALEVLYIPSGTMLQRIALSFDALLADVYWISAIQHYGGAKLADEAERNYALLYPLLDITTTLDPRFNAAYRFGAIFLTEAYPDGPGQPDEAVALLEKGGAAHARAVGVSARHRVRPLLVVARLRDGGAVVSACK